MIYSNLLPFVGPLFTLEFVRPQGAELRSMPALQLHVELGICNPKYYIEL